MKRFSLLVLIGASMVFVACPQNLKGSSGSASADGLEGTLEGKYVEAYEGFYPTPMIKHGTQKIVGVRAQILGKQALVVSLEEVDGVVLPTNAGLADVDVPADKKQYYSSLIKKGEDYLYIDDPGYSHYDLLLKKAKVKTTSPVNLSAPTKKIGFKTNAIYVGKIKKPLFATYGADLIIKSVRYVRATILSDTDVYVEILAEYKGVTYPAFSVKVNYKVENKTLRILGSDKEAGIVLTISGDYLYGHEQGVGFWLKRVK